MCSGSEIPKAHKLPRGDGISLRRRAKDYLRRRLLQVVRTAFRKGQGCDERGVVNELPVWGWLQCGLRYNSEA